MSAPELPTSNLPNPTPTKPDPSEGDQSDLAAKKPTTVMGFLKRNTKESISLGRALIMVVGGLALMFAGQWIVSHNEDAGPATPGAWISRSNSKFSGELILKVGELCLISISLELALHREAYRKFFLGLVEDAVTGDSVVSRLGNSEYLWERVSEVYFRQRFPKIHKLLSNTFYDYFPTKHPYYLDQYDTKICDIIRRGRQLRKALPNNILRSYPNLSEGSD